MLLLGPKQFLKKKEKKKSCEPKPELLSISTRPSAVDRWLLAVDFPLLFLAGESETDNFKGNHGFHNHRISPLPSSVSLLSILFCFSLVAKFKFICISIFIKWVQTCVLICVMKPTSCAASVVSKKHALV